MELFHLPIRRCVKRNGPKWLVAIVISNPSSVVLDPNMCAIPALCTRTSSLVTVWLMSSAKSRTDLRELKSNFFTTTSWFPVLWTISSETRKLSLYKTRLQKEGSMEHSQNYGHITLGSLICVKSSHFIIFNTAPLNVRKDKEGNRESTNQHCDIYYTMRVIT